jgi:hypothetical protein
LDRWESAAGRRFGGPVAFLILGELRLLASVGQLVTGRRDVRPGEVGIGHAQGRLPVELVFLGLMVVELVAVDLIVPWERLGSFAVLRWILLLASAYGLLWIVIWMTGERIRPYLATDDGLILRWGHMPIAEIPWEAVAEVREHRRYTADDARLTLDVPLQGTNLDIELTEPLEAGVPFRRRRRTVRGISLGVNDPQGAIAIMRPFVERATRKQADQ